VLNVVVCSVRVADAFLLLFVFPSPTPPPLLLHSSSTSPPPLLLHFSSTRYVPKGENAGVVSQQRAYFRELNKVIEQSEVIIQVLDARDPMGCRSKVRESALSLFCVRGGTHMWTRAR